MSPKNLAIIKEKFQRNYLIKQDQIDNLLKEFERLPDEAFEKIIKILQEAEQNQSKFIKKILSKDPNFTENLQQFLNKSYQKGTNQATQAEHDSADKLLENL